MSDIDNEKLRLFTAFAACVTEAAERYAEVALFARLAVTVKGEAALESIEIEHNAALERFNAARDREDVAWRACVEFVHGPPVEVHRAACAYCETTFDAPTREEVQSAILDHGPGCERNPLGAEIRRLRAELAAMKARAEA